MTFEAALQRKKNDPLGSHCCPLLTSKFTEVKVKKNNPTQTFTNMNIIDTGSGSCWFFYHADPVQSDEELMIDSQHCTTKPNPHQTVKIGNSSKKCREIYSLFCVCKLHSDMLSCDSVLALILFTLVVMWCLSDGARFDKLIFQESQMLVWPGSVFST